MKPSQSGSCPAELASASSTWSAIQTLKTTRVTITLASTSRRSRTSPLQAPLTSSEQPYAQVWVSPWACASQATPAVPGHNWVKARYIDPNPQGYHVVTESDEVELSNGDKITVKLERVFIPSKIRDNPRLLDGQPTYILQLKQTGSEALVRAWLMGDWDMIQGAYFDDFSPDRHVYSSSIILPAHWTRFERLTGVLLNPFLAVGTLSLMVSLATILLALS